MKRTASLLAFVVGALMSLVLATTPQPSYALKGTMEQMIDGVTSSGGGPDARSSRSNRRGVISGGSVRVRFDRGQINPQLYNVELPSFEMGCGGLDGSLGSISWISGDELMQAMRQVIGPGALAHALQLALNQMCQPCAQSMATLQDWLNSANDMLRMSCEGAGEWLYDNAFAEKAEHYGEKIEAEHDRIVQSFTGNDDHRTDTSSSTSACLSEPSCKEDMLGNVVWNHIQENNAGGWLSTVADEDEFAQFVMSLIGTQITTAAGNNETDVNVVTVPAVRPDVLSLIDDTSIPGLKCNNTTDCMLVSPGDEILSLDEPIIESVRSMLDPRDPDSLIYKFGIHYDGIGLTDEEEEFLESISGRVPLAAHARYFAMEEGGFPPFVAYALEDMTALALAQSLVEQAIEIARQVAASSPEGSENLTASADAAQEYYSKQFQKQIAEAERTIRVQGQILGFYRNN